MPFRRLLHRLFAPRATQTLSSLDAYQRWASAYPPRAHNALMEAEERAMRDLMPPLHGKTVLDLAGGTGRYGLIAAQGGARHVVNMDNSPAMLAANPLPCRALATTEAIPLPTSRIHVVICALAVGHLPHLAPTLREIARVLVPGGDALISDVHPFVALNGGQRTFSAGGQTYAVEHYIHLYGNIHRAAGEVGLEITDVLEPDIEARSGVPVVIVYRLRKG